MVLPRSVQRFCRLMSLRTDHQDLTGTGKSAVEAEPVLASRKMPHSLRCRNQNVDKERKAQQIQVVGKVQVERDSACSQPIRTCQTHLSPNFEMLSALSYHDYPVISRRCLAYWHVAYASRLSTNFMMAITHMLEYVTRSWADIPS